MYSLEPKIYKLDYEFIVNNYLDKHLWGKQWNVYTYKEHLFTLCLHEIQTEKMRICFRIHHNKTDTNRYVYYYLNHPEYTLEVLKKTIEGNIFELLLNYVRMKIKDSDSYQEFKSILSLERDVLETLAIQQMKTVGVSNKDVIDNYVSTVCDDMGLVWDLMETYVDLLQYVYDKDLLLTFANACKNTGRISSIMTAEFNISHITSVVNEINTLGSHLENGDTSDYEDLPTV